MSAWDEAVFWPAMLEAGMLKLARVALPNCPAETRAYVKFQRPDEIVMAGLSLSTEYAMQYQHADLPTLQEDVELVVDSQKYRVRSHPIVPPNGTGFFRIAPLTRVDC
jgi:hypothetical protein